MRTEITFKGVRDTYLFKIDARNYETGLSYADISVKDCVSLDDELQPWTTHKLKLLPGTIEPNEQNYTFKKIK